MKIFKGKIMPVKAVLSLVFALFAAASFVSCANDSGDDGNQGVKDTTAEKKALWAKISGTSWKAEYKRNIYNTISFSDESITIDDVQYKIDLSKDLYFDTEISDKIHKTRMGFVLYCFVNNKYIGLSNYPFEEVSDKTLDVWETHEDGGAYAFLLQTSTSGDSDSTSSVNGKYSYEATGSAISGAFTLSDGSWSYSVSKTNISTDSGTYTVSDGKVTVKWTVTAGGSEMENTETFTITDNEDGTFTWKSENDSVSLWFNLLFNIKDLELTFTKSE